MTLSLYPSRWLWLRRWWLFIWHLHLAIRRNLTLKYWTKEFVAAKSKLSSLWENTVDFNQKADAAMDPMINWLERANRLAGPCFVFMTLFVILAVVVIFCLCYLPFVWMESRVRVVLIFLFGAYILSNVFFHYYKAIFTDPGFIAKSDCLVLREVASVCAKCDTPRPPRTHHCSLCKKCVLKLDHHCPWINNCIGFYNHYDFLMFSLWIWVGAIFVSVTGYGQFKEHYLGFYDLFSMYFCDLEAQSWVESGKTSVTWLYALEKDEEFLLLLSNISLYFVGCGISILRPFAIIDEGKLYDLLVDLVLQIVKPFIAIGEISFHNLVISTYLISAGSSLLFIWLIGRHLRILSRGETSVEAVINREKKRKDPNFVNPYDFGFLQNWRIIFGLDVSERNIWHIFFPLHHEGEGDGLTFKTNLMAAASVAKRRV